MIALEDRLTRHRPVWLRLAAHTTPGASAPVPDPKEVCDLDRQDWPCDAAVAGTALRAEQDRKRVLRNAALTVYHGKIGYDHHHDPDILALGVALFPERAALAAGPTEYAMCRALPPAFCGGGFCVEAEGHYDSTARVTLLHRNQRGVMWGIPFGRT